MAEHIYSMPELEPRILRESLRGTIIPVYTYYNIVVSIFFSIIPILTPILYPYIIPITPIYPIIVVSIFFSIILI